MNAIDADSEGKGEVVVYQWVEWLREYIKQKLEEEQAEEEQSKNLELACDS